MIGEIAVASRRLASLPSVWSVRCSYNGPVSSLSRLSQESELSSREEQYGHLLCASTATGLHRYFSLNTILPRHRIRAIAT